MRQFLRVLLILGLSAVMAFTLVSCGETGGGDSVGDGDGGDKGEDDAAVELTSITVTPANPSIALLGTQQFTATGYYSDGTTEDLTTEVIWSSDDISIATTSNTLGTEGLATSKSMGTITVSALHTVTLITNTTGLNSGCWADVTNSGPVTNRTNATVTLTLSCSTEATSYACTTAGSRICISGPGDFETNTSPLTTNASAAVAACGANGVTATGCTANDGTPDILEFSGNATGIANTPEIDATGFTDLQVHFTAAYAAAATYDADENIEVNACCGSGCTPLLNIDTADSADNGGSDDWTERGPIVLPNGIFSECATTHVSFVQSTDAAGEVAHMDDFAISGAGSI
ncbi:MAG: Ig-like domain-containing protein, partial [Planctomycetota bacterium]